MGLNQSLLKTAMIVSITYKRWDWVYVLLGIAKRTSSNFGYIIWFVSGDKKDNITLRCRGVAGCWHMQMIRTQGDTTVERGTIR